MKNILVASDLSDRSRPAIRRGVQLAAQAGARLTIVHVVDGALPDQITAGVRKDAERLLREAVDAASDGHGISTDIVVALGDTVEAINEIAQSSEAGLLIVGLHRRRVFLEFVKETTMELLVRSSRLPVLLVTGDGDTPYGRVLAGIDMSATCASGLHKIAIVAPQADLTLFHAHPVSFSQEAARDFEIWQAVHNVPENLPKPIFVEGPPGEVLEQVMDGETFDLLVMGAHTRSNAARFIVGGFSAGLVRNPPCDLLLAK